MPSSIRIRRFFVRPLALVSALIWGCGYYLIPARFEPFDAELQAEPGAAATMAVFDDGTVAYVLDRLEVSVRPMTDAELNRQFPSFSKDGGGPAAPLPTNPFTFGDWTDPRTGRSPQRFSVFKISVKNYEYPKLKFDPLEVTIESGNGRTYYPWGNFDFKEYFRRFAPAHSGLGKMRFNERQDMINHTKYPDDEFVFSGQTVEGFIVFEKIHDDVREIAFHIPNVGTRYDFRSEPVETVDLVYRFKRDLHKVRTYDELATQVANP